MEVLFTEYKAFWLFLQEILKTDIEDKISDNEKLILVKEKKKKSKTINSYIKYLKGKKKLYFIHNFPLNSCPTHTHTHTHALNK